MAMEDRSEQCSSDSVVAYGLQMGLEEDEKVQMARLRLAFPHFCLYLTDTAQPQVSFLFFISIQRFLLEIQTLSSFVFVLLNLFH